MDKLKKFLFLGLLTLNNISSKDVMKSIEKYNINNINNNIIDISNDFINTSQIEIAEEIKKISFFDSIVDGLQNTKWLLKNNSFLKLGTVAVVLGTALEAYFTNDIVSVSELALLLLKHVSAHGLGLILAELLYKTSFCNSIVDGFKKTKWLLKNNLFLTLGTVEVVLATALEAYFTNDIVSVSELVLSLLKHVSAYGLGGIVGGLLYKTSFSNSIVDGFKKTKLVLKNMKNKSFNEFKKLFTNELEEKNNKKIEEELSELPKNQINKDQINKDQIKEEELLKK